MYERRGDRIQRRLVRVRSDVRSPATVSWHLATLGAVVVRTRAVLLCVLLFPFGACGGSSGSGAASSSDASLDCPSLPNPALGSPSTIADAVALANGLLAQQAPLSIDCFLSSLNRPLAVLGAVSTFSLQPSPNGALNPRMFLFSGNLVMSVVPAGTGSPLVELAEYTTPVRSIKGQLEFPLTATVSDAAPYDSIRDGTGTECGACHGGEQPAAQVTVTQAFESDVLQPVSGTNVTLEQMKNDAATCDLTQEPDRCAILDAVLDHGQVVTGSFSPDAKTIFN